MTTLGFNLDQTRVFEKHISNFRQNLTNNANYRENVLQNGDTYLMIKNTLLNIFYFYSTPEK